MVALPHHGATRLGRSAGRRLVFRILWTAALCFVAGESRPVAANPLDAFGFGARSSALAGAVTADVSDFSGNYYNPAGLARKEGLSLELGYTYLEPSLRISGGDNDVDRNYGVHGGIILPGQAWGRRFAVSVATFIPAERISRIRSLPESQPRWVLFDNRPQRIVVTASAAFELIDGLLLGAGVTFLSDTRGGVDIGGLVSADRAEDTALFSGVNVDFAAVRYPSAGLVWEASDRLRLGASYREEFSLDLDLRLNVRGDVAFTEGLPEPIVIVDGGAFSVISLNTNLFSPRQLAAGFAWEVGAWTLFGDVTWVQWSRFPAPTSEIAIELDIDPLPAPELPTASPSDPGFADIVVPRVAFEVRAVDSIPVAVDVRGGYFFEATPAPGQPGETNYLDSSKHGISAGVGLAIDGPRTLVPGELTLDLTGMALVLPERVYRKDDPADPIGDVTASGSVFGGKLTVGMEF